MIECRQLSLCRRPKACFKRRATAVLSWFDCSTTAARVGFRRRIYFSRIERLLTKTKHTKKTKQFSKLLNIF